MKEKKKKVGVAALIAGIGVLLAAIFAKAKPSIPPEDIVLSNLTISPSEAYVGETVSISVTATNIGGTTGSHEITCEVL